MLGVQHPESEGRGLGRQCSWLGLASGCLLGVGKERWLCPVGTNWAGAACEYPRAPPGNQMNFFLLCPLGSLEPQARSYLNTSASPGCTLGCKCDQCVKWEAASEASVGVGDLDLQGKGMGPPIPPKWRASLHNPPNDSSGKRLLSTRHRQQGNKMPLSPTRSLKLRSLISPSAGEEVATPELTLLVATSVGATTVEKKFGSFSSIDIRFPMTQQSPC